VAWLNTKTVYPRTVTHFSTNPARCTVTLLISPTMLPLSQTTTSISQTCNRNWDRNTSWGLTYLLTNRSQELPFQDLQYVARLLNTQHLGESLAPSPWKCHLYQMVEFDANNWKLIIMKLHHFIYKLIAVLKSMSTNSEVYTWAVWKQSL